MSLFTRTEKRYDGAKLIAEALFNRRLGTGYGSTAGQIVTEDSSMRLMAVWRCQHLLADIVSGLPLDQFRKVDGVPAEMTPSSYVAAPSEFVAPEEWRYQLMLSALQAGNAFAYVTQIGGDGRPRFAEILDPNDVMVERRDGALAPPTYKVKGRPVDIERIRHFRAFGPRPGSVCGMAPLEYAKYTMGLGLAVREYGANWYASGGHPTSLLSTDQDINADQALEAKTQWRDATTNDHLAVLGGAWKYDQVQAAPESALFLAAVNATAVDICGYYGIPPEMLGIATSGSSVTYANREQRAIDVLVWTVHWWLARVERFITRDIPNPQYVKINVDALLLTDALTRAQVHDMRIGAGITSPDEAREKEDEPPIKDGKGDVYLWPPHLRTINAATPPHDM